MSTTPARTVARLARSQYGLVSLDQLRSAGLTHDQVRTRVSRHELERVHRGVYRVPGVPRSRRGDVLALALAVGSDARACGPSAAALHGFDGFHLVPPYHLVVPRRGGIAPRGHRLHATTTLPLIDRATVDEIPVTSAARTVVDLAAAASPERLAAALDSGLRDGLYNESLLHRRIVALRGPGRHGVPRLLAVINGHEVTRGGHSWLEREYLRLIDDAGLPRPVCQVVMTTARDRLVRVDFRFPGTRVVAEVLGYRFHRTRDQMRRDAERLNALVVAGAIPVQHTYDQVVADPQGVVADLRRAIEFDRRAA